MIYLSPFYCTPPSPHRRRHPSVPRTRALSRPRTRAGIRASASRRARIQQTNRRCVGQTASSQPRWAKGHRRPPAPPAEWAPTTWSWSRSGPRRLTPRTPQRAAAPLSPPPITSGRLFVTRTLTPTVEILTYPCNATKKIRRVSSVEVPTMSRASGENGAVVACSIARRSKRLVNYCRAPRVVTSPLVTSTPGVAPLSRAEHATAGPAAAAGVTDHRRPQ